MTCTLSLSLCINYTLDLGLSLSLSHLWDSETHIRFGPICGLQKSSERLSEAGIQNGIAAPLVVAA